MAYVVKDRVKVTSTTTGTGTLTLGSAPTGFQAFSVIGNGNTCPYVILEASESAPTQWEVGIGTYTSSGTTLARTTVLANSSGGTSAITLAAGTHTVICGFHAAAAQELWNMSNAGCCIVPNGSAQTVAGSASTTITTGLSATPTSDPFGWWDGTNKKFIPTRAGTYLLFVSAQLSGTSCQAQVRLNGSSTYPVFGSFAGMAWETSVGSGLVAMNGSTDYLQICVWNGMSDTNTATIQFQAIYYGP